jgi:hypothetical protein
MLPLDVSTPTLLLINAHQKDNAPKILTVSTGDIPTVSERNVKNQNAIFSSVLVFLLLKIESVLAKTNVN